MIRFKDLQQKVEEYCSNPEELALLRKAYDSSARGHQGQVRRSGEPYLVHPLEVASILADLRLDVPCVAVGLLHDLVEDTHMTQEEIAEEFGTEIAQIVGGVTKISKIAFRSRAKHQAENFRKMILAMADDIRVILVKLADRLHNMRTLEHMRPQKRERIARETMQIYVPIANRLGMNRIKTEMEDLALRDLDPQGYADLKARLAARATGDEDFIQQIRSILTGQMRENRIQGEIHGRIKNLHGIYKKMKERQIDVDQVYDTVAFRIITESISDCYAALGVVHKLWRPIPGRFKDFIAMTKPNGYQSLHTSVISDEGVPFEVQIRTAQMHRIAEDGIAAHWVYKDKDRAALSAEERKAIEWVRQLVETQREAEDSREFYKGVKMELYGDEVYVFTPGGDVIELPRGATPLDFAYRIHTEVGHHCVTAVVNGRAAPLRTELQNGDIVEILTKPSQHPSRDWLSFVKTSTARSKIRHWLQRQLRERSLEVGRGQLERALRQYGYSWKRFIHLGTLLTALQKLGYADLEGFLAAVGLGKMVPRDLLELTLPDELLKKAAGGNGGPPPAPARPPRPARRKGRQVVVRGHDDIMVQLARCCRPIKGDAIVGYITRGRGVSVHTADCPNVQPLLCEEDRAIEVSWDKADAERYAATLTIHSEDRPGILANLSAIIAEKKSNIKHVDAETSDDQRGLIRVTLEIDDRKHLERIMAKISQMKGIHEVFRG